MSDLDPHLSPFEVELVDPAVTRLVSCDGAGAAASLLERLGPVATSISFVVPEDARAGAQFAATLRDWTLRDWKPNHLRVEVLAVSGVQDRRPVVAAGELEGTAVPLRALSRPLGGRAAVLASATEAAEHDFVVVTSSDDVPLSALTAALGHMWAEGCDAALIEPPSSDGSTPSAAVDAAGELASWLAQAGGSGRVVVLRRWVARWLFNEVNRAIDPWVEVADRARLLGIGIVHLPAERSQPGVVPPPSADLR